MTDVPRCESCRAPVRWARTAAGKPMIFDAKPVEVAGKWTIGGDGVAIYHGKAFAGVGFIPHWATCPDAAGWRARGKR